jgi:hypothetical protein
LIQPFFDTPAREKIDRPVAVNRLEEKWHLPPEQGNSLRNTFQKEISLSKIRILYQKAIEDVKGLHTLFHVALYKGIARENAKSWATQLRELIVGSPSFREPPAAGEACQTLTALLDQHNAAHKAWINPLLQKIKKVKTQETEIKKIKAIKSVIRTFFESEECKNLTKSYNDDLKKQAVEQQKRIMQYMVELIKTHAIFKHLETLQKELYKRRAYFQTQGIAGSSLFSSHTPNELNT